jgi:hypothetical protein
MLGSSLARATQDGQQVRRHRLQPYRLFDELWQTVFDANTRAKIAHQYRTLNADQFHARADFVDGGVVLGRARFLAQTHECRAEQALHLGVFFSNDLFAQLADGLRHGLAAEARVKIGDLAQSDCGAAARFNFLCTQATRVIVQNVGSELLVITLQ